MRPRTPGWAVLAVAVTAASIGLTAPAHAADRTGKPVPPDGQSVNIIREPARPAGLRNYDPGTEPTLPYAQPTDATLPRAGCDSTVTDPKAPPASAIPAIQIIYGWNDATGNNYTANVEKVARAFDRIDWSFDESSNYDQHIKLSCKSGATGTYNEYAKAMVVEQKFTGSDFTTMYNNLAAAGYDEPNRWYFVFTDFAAPSEANSGCTTTGGAICFGKAEVWDSGVSGHEVLHLLGAGHAYHTEEVWQDSNGNWFAQQFLPDIMMDWGNWWLLDMGYRQNYDPSELSATFNVDNYPSTVKRNVAAHPLATTPGATLDQGANNDLLTAQERTIEAQSPGTAYPNGFVFNGSGSTRVTPEGLYSGLSVKYYDNRRSLEALFDARTIEAAVSVSRRPAVTPANNYEFFARIRSDVPASTQLRLRWYNSSGGVISTSSGPAFTPASNWLEFHHAAVAPAGAATVQISVVNPVGSNQPANGQYNLDTLQLSNCTANRNGVCRPEL